MTSHKKKKEAKSRGHMREEKTKKKKEMKGARLPKDKGETQKKTGKDGYKSVNSSRM